MNLVEWQEINLEKKKIGEPYVLKKEFKYSIRYLYDQILIFGGKNPFGHKPVLFFPVSVNGILILPVP